MKSSIALSICCVPISFALCGATINSDTDPYTLTARGPHHTVWQRPVWEVTPFGKRAPHFQRYVEMQTGLSYFNDQTGQYEESDPNFEIAQDGSAVAKKTQHRVTIYPSLTTPGGAVEFRTPEGQTLRSCIIGLNLFDEASGRNIQIASTRNVTAVQTAANEIVWPDAFDGFKADIRILNEKGQFHQEVLLKEKFSDAQLANLGFNASARLEVWTRFFTAPSPKVAATQVQSDADQTLDWGGSRMGQGIAFADANSENSVSVSKEWQTIDEQSWLIEAVVYGELAPLLQDLPVKTASLSPKNRKSPSGMRAGRTPPQREEFARSDGERIRRASLRVARSSPPQVVLDYVMLNTTLTNYAFLADTTYYFSGDVSLYGTNTTFEGLSVLKFDSGVGLTVNTPVTWLASDYTPVVMVSKDDDTTGDPISGSTGNPGTNYYASKALYFNASTANTNLTLQNVRIANAQTAIAISGSTNHILTHVQLVKCGNGLAITNAEVKLRNALFDRVQTNFTGSSATGRVEHLTADIANWFNKDIGSSLFVTNSLLVGVTNLGNYSVLQNVSTNSSAAGIFQIVGSGAHYLAAGSTNRNAGTTNINPALLSSLKQRTTYPPVVYSNITILLDTTFNPQARRDTDVPDIGWHYSPLDYAFGGVTGSGNLTFSAGTAAGWFRTSSGWQNAGHGIHLSDTKTATFDGHVDARNYWVRYNTVQEDANGIWAGGYGPGGITGSAATHFTAPQIRARFLFTSILAGEGGSANPFRDDSGYLLVNSRDSEYHGGGMGGYVSTHCHTNCLFERCNLWVDSGMADNVYTFRNCTIFQGYISINRYTGTRLPVSFRGCAMDSISFPAVDPLAYDPSVTDYDYNAFITNSTYTTPAGAHDVYVMTNFNWQTSWLGRFYLPINSPLTNHTELTADLVGLYHFTTQTNQTKETNSVADISYHYVALTGTGFPVDFDGDGVPDYLEDLNGNGNGADDPTSWQTYNSPNGLIGTAALQVFTPLK
jgi:hypothetical protein